MSIDSFIKPLAPPPEVFDATQAQEVLRFWVADGIDHLSLEINSVGSSDGDYHGAEIRGSLLADIARHVLNAYGQDFDCDENANELFALLHRGYNERLSLKVDENVIGTLRGATKHAH